MWLLQPLTHSEQWRRWREGAFPQAPQRQHVARRSRGSRLHLPAAGRCAQQRRSVPRAAMRVGRAARIAPAAAASADRRRGACGARRRIRADAPPQKRHGRRRRHRAVSPLPAREPTPLPEWLRADSHAASHSVRARCCALRRQRARRSLGPRAVAVSQAARKIHGTLRTTSAPRSRAPVASVSACQFGNSRKPRRPPPQARAALERARAQLKRAAPSAV